MTPSTSASVLERWHASRRQARRDGVDDAGGAQPGVEVVESRAAGGPHPLAAEHADGHDVGEVGPRFAGSDGQPEIEEPRGQPPREPEAVLLDRRGAELREHLERPFGGDRTEVVVIAEIETARPGA